MSADPPAALGRKPRPGPLDIFGAVTLGLVLFNAALLFTGSFPPVTGVQVFYWQRYNSLLYWLRFWGVILAPICIAIWWPIFFRRRRKPQAFVVLLTATCGAGLCLCINYWTIVVSGFVGNVDSVAFHGRIYQLTRFSEYDQSDVYYLAECDSSGFWWVFRPMYQTYGGPPEANPYFVVSTSAVQIEVVLDTQVIYTYDGDRSYCYQPKYLFSATP